MRHGHAYAQYLFKLLGVAQGFSYRKTWTKKLPTDGIWVAKTPLLNVEAVPLAALEVANSESPKVVKGSLTVLAEVSPALGILVIQEEDIRRRLIRSGFASDEADRYVTRKLDDAREIAQKFHQRIQVWSFEQLKLRARLAGIRIF
jgi:hypothetical protein